MENFNQNSQEKNFMTTKEWILTLLVMMIPLVNIIFLFVYAFSGNKESRKNLFRFSLIAFAVSLPFMIAIFGMVGSVTLYSYAKYREHARFEEAMIPLEGVKKQVELCIFDEGDAKNCNSCKSGNGWKLYSPKSFGSRYLESIEVKGGVITVLTKQNHILDNVNYILYPEVNETNGVVTWKVDPKSTCLQEQFC
ncbi:MAG: hypothetical protein SPK04_03715 [Succinivibrionaceae bacterium]|nr:hypothetical protein [Succinivibrionaceae bacterium]